MSTDQRIFVVKTYYKQNESPTVTVRVLRGILGRNAAPNESSVRRLISKFETTGSVINIKKTGRRRLVRTDENIAIVNDSVTVSPTRSIRRRSQQLNLSSTSLQRILSKDLHMHAYKVQLTQEVKPTDHGRRRQFADWILARQAGDMNFVNRIIFSDEAHFHLNGYVNKQNCRVWGTENPRVFVEKKMYPLRTTVWCALWAGGVIGPFFFEDDEGATVTVNGDRYRSMISEWLWPILENMDIDSFWFQQDGATCHSALETVALLHDKFPNRVISRHGDREWPARSCDLTPCDFFLWGFVKSKVYENNPQTIPELKENIQAVINNIQPDVCERVMENFKDRIMRCRAAMGGHMPDVIFHT